MVETFVYFGIRLRKIRPSSGQKGRGLSAYLSLPGFSYGNEAGTVGRCLVLLDFARGTEPLRTVPSMATPLGQGTSRRRLPDSISS